MEKAALALVALGIIGLIWSLMEWLKARRVTRTPFVSTLEASTRGMQICSGNGISAEGKVICGEPLVAPFSGTRCLYYDLKCTAEWKEGETQKKKQLAHDQSAAKFAIDDGSGPVWVDAGQGGNFEPTQIKKETKGTGLIGGVVGKDLMFGNYCVSPGMLSLGTKYTVEETVLPVQPALYVCGNASHGAIVAPGGLRSMLISHQTRDVLLRSAAKGSKVGLLGGGAAVVVGALLGIIATLGRDADAVPAKPLPSVAPPVAAAPPVEHSPVAMAAAPENAAAVAAPRPTLTQLDTPKAKSPAATPRSSAKPVPASSAKPAAAGSVRVAGAKPPGAHSAK